MRFTFDLSALAQSLYIMLQGMVGGLAVMVVLWGALKILCRLGGGKRA